MEKAYLVLADGTVYEGYSFGADVEKTGELVFTTGVCGYLETLTDPNYAGQIVMQTFPIIGNYGVIPEDLGGDCVLSGYVVREYCDTPSNFRSQGTLGDFLKKQGVPAICGVDTRALTRKLREEGVMNARICREIPSDRSGIRDHRAAAEEVRGGETKVIAAQGEAKYRVAVLNLGNVGNFAEELSKRGAEVTVFPAGTDAEAVMAVQPDGILLSDGAGDPAERACAIGTAAALMGKAPMMGIGLGHQVMALAMGGRTEKLPYGHRGANQPVKDVERGRTYITSQNHGYAVVNGSVKDGKITFVNGNDGTCEGMEYAAQKAFGVQFHPDVYAGPQDMSFLYDRFMENMGGER